MGRSLLPACSSATPDLGLSASPSTSPSCTTVNPPCTSPSLNRTPASTSGSRTSTSSAHGPQADALPQHKKPRKRRGVHMDRLRQEYAISTARESTHSRVESLSPTSTGSGMAQLELAASLSFHLISVARKSIKTYNHPNWTDLSTAILNIHDRLRNPSDTTDLIVASLIAIGSRRSTHSAITGHPDQTEPLSRSALYSLQLGQKREGACQALVQRALDLAEANGVLTDPTADSVEVLSHLRLMMMTTSPRHPRFIELDRVAGRHYRALDGGRSGQSYVASDAVAALVFDQPLDIQDSELDTFGWPELDVVALKREVDDLAFNSIMDTVVIDTMRRMTVATMRLIASLRARGWHQHDPNSLPLPARPVFDTIAQLIAVIESALIALHATPVAPDQAEAQLLKNLHTLKLPLAFHAGARKLAQQLVQSDCDPSEASLLEVEVTVRCLRWVKRFFEVLAGSVASQIDGYHHALLVDTLDQVVPDWLALVTSAARQHAAGHGPYAAVGLSWSDLRRFHVCLQWATSTFATCVERERLLAAVLDEAARAGREGGCDAQLVALGLGGGRARDGMARRMVDRALVEMDS